MPAVPLVSVIVPVHGAEALLARCLDSLLGQTLANIEILVLNDASPDNSPRISAAYAARDARVRLAANPVNLGLYATRTRGFSLARGDYLAVCDADDSLPPRALEGLWRKACSTQADIVHGRCQGCGPGDVRRRLIVSDPFRVDSGPRYVSAFLRNFRGWNLWGKLYRRRLWEAIAGSLPRDKNWFLAEDLLLSFMLGLAAEGYAELRETVYHYTLPTAHYFEQPDQARKKIRDHLEILAFLRAESLNPGRPPHLPGLVDDLIRHIVASILRNAPASAEARHSLAGEIAAALGAAAPPPRADRGAAHARLARLSRKAVGRLRDCGLREFYIYARRFAEAAKKEAGGPYFGNWTECRVREAAPALRAFPESTL